MNLHNTALQLLSLRASRFFSSRWTIGPSYLSNYVRHVQSDLQRPVVFLNTLLRELKLRANVKVFDVLLRDP